MRRRLAPARCARIRCDRGLRRTGDGRPHGHRAAGHGHRGALMAGMAAPDPHVRRAWRGPHRLHRRFRACPPLRGEARGGGDRRLPGSACRDGAHHDARARRLGYERRCGRGRDRSRALRHLHRRRRRLHHGPADRAQGEAARSRGFRGNAGNGVARCQGAPGAAPSKSP